MEKVHKLLLSQTLYSVHSLLGSYYSSTLDYQYGALIHGRI